MGPLLILLGATRERGDPQITQKARITVALAPAEGPSVGDNYEVPASFLTYMGFTAATYRGRSPYLA